MNPLRKTNQMKKELLYLLMACLMACPVFTSCSDDDDNIPEDVPEGGAVENFDQQACLQEALVEVDESGNFVRSKQGYPLDAANPTCFSLEAKTLEDAKTAFKGLFTPDVKFEEADGAITANLVNEEGESQGHVSFTPTTGEADGAIARVTFHTTPAIKYVSELRYLSVWGEDNAFQISPFAVGDVVVKEVGFLNIGKQNWVCLREATSSSKGILVYISPKRYRGYWDLGERTLASYNDVKVVSDIMRSNWGKYTGHLKAAGLGAGDNITVWYGKLKDKFIYFRRDYMNLQNGETDWNNVRHKYNEREFILIEYFDMMTFE
ncbi:hypothetical protein IMSAGC004_01866 [Bacteroidaceae bacterium]|nr:hypothetical protein IMSAGC004_01866 [Bacteroidaceae bacterium]